MKAKTREILEECIETGIVHGYAKAHKHADNPTELHIKSCIEISIWYEIDEKFTFEDPHRQALDRMVAFNEEHGLYDLKEKNT
jgi:hypothetical protein